MTDRRSGRVSWFDPEGRYVRQARPARDALVGGIPTNHRLGLTMWIEGDLFFTGTYESGLAPPGRRIRMESGGLLHRGGDVVRFLGPFPGPEYFRLDEPSSGRLAYFANRTEFVFGGEPTRLFIGNSRPFEVLVFRLDGHLERIIRDSLRPGVVSDSDIAWERWELLDWGEQSGQLGEFNRLADAMPIPETKPAFEMLVVDSGGNLWVPWP